MAGEQQIEEKQFVEEVGMFFEQTGLPRMAGRILGWLLISDPPHQSIDELTEVLMASKGSISTMTRILIQFGLIERVSLPGIRHTYFRLKTGASHHAILQNAERIHSLRQLAEKGLNLVQNKSPLTRQWLEEMRDMYAFCEREFPALLTRWEHERKGSAPLIEREALK